MAYVLIDSGVPVANNNGTILKGGNVSDDRFDVKSVMDIIAQTSSHGSITPGSGATDYLRAADTTGNFNVVTEDHYVGPFITDGTLAGVAKTAHKGPASDYGRRGIHRNVSAKQVDITSWNYETGAATKGGNAGVSYDMMAPQGGVVDDASNPTLGVPGGLVYLDGSTEPVQDLYTARNQVK